jgi:hypothetical protein
MLDEETKGEAGENVVALTEEELWKRRYDKVNADFEEWERNHPGYNVLHPEYVQFNQLLNDAERRWKDARAAAEENEPKKRSVDLKFWLHIKDQFPKSTVVYR